MTTSTDSGTSPQPGHAGRLRASDAQREAVVHRLHDAVGLGMLTVEECSERTTAAYDARYVDELPALTADLPEPPPVPPAAPGWRSVGSMAALQARTTLLGAPSWAAADRRRRRLVLLTGLLLTLLLVVLITAAAVAAGHDAGYWSDHHHWDNWDD